MPNAPIHNTSLDIVIVTTAAPPWLTGTAVNPALRAAHLALKGHRVKLLVPFLPPDEQHNIFAPGVSFASAEQQQRHVQRFLEARTGRRVVVDVVFYPGRYDKLFCSIIPVGDLTLLVKPDLVLLEEPEHLTWYHHGPRWMSCFPNVTGIAHTNYVDYVAREAGEAAALGIARLNRFLVGVHCHRVIKLSDAVQSLPRQVTMFVHGVSSGFLDVGQRVASGAITQSPGVYFLGKALWSKGYRELLDALEHASQTTDNPVHCDVYGKGEHLEEIQHEAEQKGLSITFHGAKDHLDADLHTMQVFINPSTSDVVATTSAEALAMNKWLVCQRHPCNAFFEQHFANALVYDDLDGFCECVTRALAGPPAPLTPEEQRLLTWDDACDRLLAVVTLTGDAPQQLDSANQGAIKSTLESLTYTAYSKLLGIELIRRAVGAGRNTKRGEGEAALAAQLEELAQLETYPQGCY